MLIKLKQFAKSLSFKVGIVIILVEIITLSILGVFYINRFSIEVDQRINHNAQLPGLLINEGVLDLDAIADSEIMHHIVGEELLSGMIIGINGTIYCSHDNKFLGKNISQIDNVDHALLDFNNTQIQSYFFKDRIISFSPIFASDKITPQFFVYIELDTRETNTEKEINRNIFILGSVLTILITSIIIIMVFSRTVTRRVHSLTKILRQAEKGDLTVRSNYISSGDEIGIIQLRTNAMLAANQEFKEKQIKAQKELKKYSENLEAMVRERTIKLGVINKELEAFSYSVSHDLRAPLRGIDGFSQALLEDYESKLDKQGKDYLNRIRSATSRMSELINDLLSLSRIAQKKLNYEKVNLSKMVNEIVEDYKKLQPEREIEFKIVPMLTTAGDKKLIRIVLENLLSNAIKYTKNNNNTIVKFESININRSKVFVIRDNGVGFDMTYKDKLFVPFQRLHSQLEFEGTGIGLAIVQRIINLHNGKVWAESQVGKGAAFYFTLKS